LKDNASAQDQIIAALVAAGQLKEAELERARQLQADTGGGLLVLLARLGLVAERDHARACADVLGLPLMSAREVPELPPGALTQTALPSVKFLKQFHLCPLDEQGGRLRVWMADPYDVYALDAVRLACGREIAGLQRGGSFGGGKPM